MLSMPGKKPNWYIIATQTATINVPAVADADENSPATNIVAAPAA